MSRTMPNRDLQLRLEAAASVPVNLPWQIEAGYLRLASRNDRDESVTLGVWGPGELVIPSLIGCFPIEVITISAVKLREVEPSTQQRDAFLLNQSLQTITLLRITRSRPAETRLFQVLLWLGERFGQDSTRGVCLSFEELNLTHQNLAEISGLTRVTVTKALSHFRKAGLLQKEGDDDLLLRGSLDALSTR
jgi:hypothetical protein